MFITVDRAMELEIIIKEKSGTMLATTWFRLVDLSDYLEKKYGKDRSDVELEEIWLDLEPSGQLSFKVDFGNSY